MLAFHLFGPASVSALQSLKMLFASQILLHIHLAIALTTTRIKHIASISGPKDRSAACAHVPNTDAQF